MLLSEGTLALYGSTKFSIHLHFLSQNSVQSIAFHLLCMSSPSPLFCVSLFVFHVPSCTGSLTRASDHLVLSLPGLCLSHWHLDCHTRYGTWDSVTSLVLLTFIVWLRSVCQGLYFMSLLCVFPALLFRKESLGLIHVQGVCGCGKWVPCLWI